MARHAFHFEIKADRHERLRELNERYGDVEGFGGVEKYILGNEYIELVEFDGDVGEYGKQLAADPEVREFLRAVGDCFVQPLSEMGDRRMDPLQSVSVESAEVAYPGGAGVRRRAGLQFLTTLLHLGPLGGWEPPSTHSPKEAPDGSPG